MSHDHPCPICPRHPSVHLDRAFVRRGPHVAQVCLHCGRSLRGPGVWVPLAELRAAGIDPTTLPTWDAILAAINARQPSLFDRKGDCQ